MNSIFLPPRPLDTSENIIHEEWTAKACSGAQVGQSQGRVIGNGPMGELCYAADAPII